MKIGVAKERWPGESRVGLTPAAVGQLLAEQHEVLIEAKAGAEAGFDDASYSRAGARLVGPEELWATSELLIKVKAPTEHEYELLRDGLTLLAFFHLAANPSLTRALLDARVCALAYETIKDSEGRLPVLAPMSEIGGRLAAQTGAYLLQQPRGRGILIGGAPGVPAAKVLIVGAGNAGAQAARIASGMGARVTIIERRVERLRQLEHLFGGRMRLLLFDSETLEDEIDDVDLLIAAPCVQGARAPCLIPRELLEEMKPGSVLVDMAIDQGGCAVTSRPTTTQDPVYTVDGVVHYCVPNMPSSVPELASRALSTATLPFVRRLASQGLEAALRQDQGLARGVNVRNGGVVFAGLTQSQETEFPSASACGLLCGSGQNP